MCLAPRVEHGHLTDRGRNARVFRGGRKRVSAAHRGSEGRHSLGVDARQRASEPDCRSPILQLASRAEKIGLAAAISEATMIKDEGSNANGREALREGS